MKIFDTHCHIADSAFDADLQEVIDRFHAAGICRVNVVADPCEEEPNQQKVFAWWKKTKAFMLPLARIRTMPAAMTTQPRRRY